MWSSFAYLSFSSTSSVRLFLSKSLFLNCLSSSPFYSFTLFILSFSRVGHYTHNISITNNRNKITHNINIHIWISLKTFPVFLHLFHHLHFQRKIFFENANLLCLRLGWAFFIFKYWLLNLNILYWKSSKGFKKCSFIVNQIL